jgi:plastocyanin
MKRALLAAAVAAGLLMGCTADDAGGGDPDLRAADFAFEPSQVTVTAGEVSLRVANDDDAQHNVTIDEFGVDTDIAGGDDAVLEFTAESQGNFAFFCKFHPEQMVGQLTVE